MIILAASVASVRSCRNTEIGVVLVDYGSALKLVWIREVRVFVEIKQILHVLVAH